jgi:aquaporin Z
MVSDVAGVSGRWSPPSRSFSGGVCPDLVGADLSHYWIYLVGPLLGAMVAVGFEFILRGKATKAGGEAAQGILVANPEGV